MTVGFHMDFTDLIAERATLSIICNAPAEFFTVADYLYSEDFSTNTNKMIFKCIDKLIEAEPDSFDHFMVRSTAKELGFDNYDELTDKGAYTEALFIQKVNKKNLEKCARRVKDLSLKRRLLEETSSMHEAILESEKGQTSSIDLIGNFETRIASLINDVDNRNKITLLGDGFLELVNERADNPVESIGLPSGLQRFDEAIGGGFRKASVTLVGARPKNFKSGFALNVARNLAVDKIYRGKQVPVLILDTELQEEYQKFRLGASASITSINQLETGQWRSNRGIVEAVNAAGRRIKGAPLYHIYVGGFPIDRIISTIKYWLTKYVGRDNKGKFNDCLIIYDYIKLMDTKEIKGDLKEWQVLGFHMTALQDLLVRCDVPMLCMCQLNRDGSDSDDDTVFAGADRLIWFASNINILRNKLTEELQRDGPGAGNMRIKTIMTRFGPGMDQNNYLNLIVNKACMHVREGKLLSELNVGQEVGRAEADAMDDEVEGPYD